MVTVAQYEASDDLRFRAATISSAPPGRTLTDPAARGGLGAFPRFRSSFFSSLPVMAKPRCRARPPVFPFTPASRSDGIPSCRRTPQITASCSTDLRIVDLSGRPLVGFGRAACQSAPLARFHAVTALRLTGQRGGCIWPDRWRTSLPILLAFVIAVKPRLGSPPLRIARFS